MRPNPVAREDDAFARQVKEHLEKHRPTSDLLDALEQFGGPMLDEMLSRVQLIETKAISILGWSTALLGFLLLQPRIPAPGGLRLWLLRLTVLAAIAAVAAAAEAARSRVWEWPSVKHWFCLQEFDSPDRLRRVHLFALLDSYHAHKQLAGHKGWALRIAERCLFGAAVLVATLLLLRLA